VAAAGIIQEHIFKTSSDKQNRPIKHQSAPHQSFLIQKHQFTVKLDFPLYDIYYVVFA
jgi:hypothetical protein